MNRDDGYRLLGGKCDSICKAIAAAHPEFRLVRGHYHCPIWDRDRAHWWLVAEDGTIYDPTREQFPSAGLGEHTELDTKRIPCSQCGKTGNEAEMRFESNYAFCSSVCFGKFVGVECL